MHESKEQNCPLCERVSIVSIEGDHQWYKFECPYCKNLEMSNLVLRKLQAKRDKSSSHLDAMSKRAHQMTKDQAMIIRLPSAEQQTRDPYLDIEAIITDRTKI